MIDAGLVNSSWDMTPPEALSGATRREVTQTGPNPYAAEFVPGSTSYGHESAEFVADPDEQWFPLHEDYQHAGEMAHGYYDEYTQSAEADGYDMGYQTYGYEYGDQAVDAGNPCKKSLENERHGRDRPFERSEEREMIEFYAAILELRGIPVHCLLRAKMS